MTDLACGVFSILRKFSLYRLFGMIKTHFNVVLNVSELHATCL